MTQRQLYWPNWWKLWPNYSVNKDDYNGRLFYHHTFCFGPLQFRWKSFP